MTKTPNPGSKEAQEMGCTCPVMDNHYGKGFMQGDNGPMFWMTKDCGVHWMPNMKVEEKTDG